MKQPKEEYDHDIEMDNSNSNEGLNDSQTSLHPLLIEHVANKVFSYLGWNYSKDIRACREVCNLWNNLISNGVKRRGRAPEFTFKYADTNRLENFVLSMRSTTNLPFDKFSFDVHFFVDRHLQLFNSFLGLFSPFITHLSLTFGKHYSLNLQSLDLDAVSFQNLKSLSFKCSYLTSMPGRPAKSFCTWYPPQPQQQLEGLLSLFKVILGTAMELESVELHLPCSYIDGDTDKLADVKFGNILAKHVPETVTRLNLTMRLADSHLNGLIRLKLKKLHLRFYGSRMSLDCLKSFLQQNSGTLLELRLVDFEDRYVDWNQVFPIFGKLTTIEVKDSEFYIYHHPTHYPKLEKLVILTEYSTASRINLEALENYSYASVRELDLQYVVTTPSSIQPIPCHFPNVTICRIQADQDSRQAVGKLFQVLTNLKELQITFHHFTSRYCVDPMLTGLTPAQCDLIRGDCTYEPHLISQILDSDDRTQRNACLENLRGLKKLIIDIQSPSIHLSDVSVYYALFRSPSLQEVSILGYHDISATCADLIQMRLNVNGEQQLQQRSPPTIDGYDYSMAIVPVPANNR